MEGMQSRSPCLGNKKALSKCDHAFFFPGCQFAPGGSLAGNDSPVLTGFLVSLCDTPVSALSWQQERLRQLETELSPVSPLCR